MFRKILNRLFTILFRWLVGYKISLLRKAFWNLNAKNIDNKWGKSRADYNVLKTIITSINPKRILDVGCGSGRLFRLYHSLGIREIVGQDISQSALYLARKQKSYNCQNILLLNTPITKLNFPNSYFDLIICNRVLQHIPPNSIKSVIKAICMMASFVYINEISLDTDEVSPVTPYIFKHKYISFFSNCDLMVKDRGFIGKQSWILFKKNPDIGQ